MHVLYLISCLFLLILTEAGLPKCPYNLPRLRRVSSFAYVLLSTHRFARSHHQTCNSTVLNVISGFHLFWSFFVVNTV